MSLSVVQAANTYSTAASSSVSATLTTTAGNLLVAHVREGTNAIDGFTVTDNTGQTWSQISGYNTANVTNRSGLFYIWNSKSVTSVTANFTTGGGVVNRGIIVYEISGADPSSVLDVGGFTSSFSSSASSLTSASLTSINANDILLYCMDVTTDQTTWTAGSGYTIPTNGSGTRQSISYKVVSGVQSGVTTSTSWGVATGAGTSFFIALKAKTSSNINYIGGATNAPAAATTNAVSYSSTTGNTLLATVTTVTATVQWIDDNASGNSNTWTLIGTASNGTSVHTEVWCCYKAKAATSFTAHLSASDTSVICIGEYSGVKGIGCTANTGAGSFNTNSNTAASSSFGSITLNTTDSSCYSLMAVGGVGGNQIFANTGDLRLQAINGSTIAGSLADASGYSSSVLTKVTIGNAEAWVALAVELLDVAINNVDSFVQSNYGTAGTTATTLALQFRSNPVKGNAFIVCVYINNTGAPGTISVADNNSNVYNTVATFSGSTSEGTISMFYATNVAVTPNANPTITITSSVAWSNWNATISEYNGIQATGPVDQTNVQGDPLQFSTTPTVGPVTTTQNSEVLVAFIGSGNGSSSVIQNGSSGWLFDSAYTNNQSIAVQHKCVAATQSSLSSTINFNPGIYFFGVLATFRLAPTAIVDNNSLFDTLPSFPPTVRSEEMIDKGLTFTIPNLSDRLEGDPPARPMFVPWDFDIQLGLLVVPVVLPDSPTEYPNPRYYPTHEMDDGSYLLKAWFIPWDPTQKGGWDFERAYQVPWSPWDNDRDVDDWQRYIILPPPAWDTDAEQQQLIINDRNFFDFDWVNHSIWPVPPHIEPPVVRPCDGFTPTTEFVSEVTRLADGQLLDMIVNAQTAGWWTFCERRFAYQQLQTRITGYAFSNPLLASKLNFLITLKTLEITEFAYFVYLMELGY